MRKGNIAVRDSRWEEFKEECRAKEKSSEWAPGTIREACGKVAKEEVGRVGIVQEIFRKSMNFLRRIIAPVCGRLSYICPHCNLFPLEDIFGGYRLERSTAAGGVQFVEKDMNGEHPTGFQ